MAVEMKRCKVYPRNGLQFIPGILEKRKRFEFPAELPLSPHEVRRCLSYADVYEVREDGTCVLLTLENYLADNTDAPEATDVPEDELLYPRDEKEDEGGEEETEDDSEETVEEPPVTESVAKAAATNPAVANAKKEYTSPKASKQYQGQQKAAQTSETTVEEKKAENEPDNK